MSEGELASTTSDNLVKRDEHGRLLPGQKSLNPPCANQILSVVSVEMSSVL